MKKRVLILAVAGILGSFILFGCDSRETDRTSTSEAVFEAPEEHTVSGTDTASDVIDAATDGNNADADTGGIIYNKFYDIVTGIDPKKWDGFALIDLDGDGVCELFATCIDGEREDEGIQPYMIVGHDDNETSVNDELSDGVAGIGGYRGSLYYLEGKGLLLERMVYAPYGLPADTIYTLNDGKIEISDNGDFSVDDYDDAEDDSWDPFEHGLWIWNGETVTEERYNELLKEATDDTEGSLMREIDWKSRDEIIEELRGKREAG